MSPTRCFILSLLLILAATERAYCQGGPPLIGDDPGTPGSGKWEINTAFTFERTPEKKTFELPHVDLNYGLGDHIQLKYEVGYLLLDDRGSGWHNGVGNSILGWKWRFLDEDRQGISMSIYPQLEINTPPGITRRALVESGTNLFLPVEVAKTFGPWELDAELGYEFQQHQKDTWQSGFIAGYKATKQLELLAEVRDIIDQDFRRNDIIFNVGARWEFVDNVDLLLAAGRSLRNSDDSPTFLLYAGLRLNL